MTTTTTEQATATRVVQFTFNAADLQAAIDWVGHAASRDDTLPTLTAVQFRYGPATEHPGHYRSGFPLERQYPTGYAVTLATTDRYRLAYATTLLADTDTVTEQPPAGTFLIPAKDLIAAAKAWPKAKARQTAPVTVTITATEQMIDITAHDPATLASATTSVRTVLGDFPKYDRLLPSTDPERHGTAAIAVTPAYLQGFTAAATKVTKTLTGIPPIQLGFTAPKKPIAITVDAGFDSRVQFSGLLMPVRTDR